MSYEILAVKVTTVKNISLLQHVIDPRKSYQRNEITNVIIAAQKLIILDRGSFNLPDIDWESRNIKKC